MAEGGWDLEAAITGALDSGEPGEPRGATARRVLEAISQVAHTGWVATSATQAADGTPQAVEVVDELGDTRAEMSGCVHYWQYYNGAFHRGDEADSSDVEYLHICELDRHIASMVALREIRRRFTAGEPLPSCRHESARYLKLGERQACQACGEVVDIHSPPRPPKTEVMRPHSKPTPREELRERIAAEHGPDAGAFVDAWWESAKRADFGDPNPSTAHTGFDGLAALGRGEMGKPAHDPFPDVDPVAEATRERALRDLEAMLEAINARHARALAAEAALAAWASTPPLAAWGWLRHCATLDLRVQRAPVSPGLLPGLVDGALSAVRLNPPPGGPAPDGDGVAGLLATWENTP